MEEKTCQQEECNHKVHNDYLSCVSKYVAKLFIMVKSKSFPLKRNRKFQWKEDLKCRFCGKYEENEEHIFGECETINQTFGKDIKLLITDFL